MPPSLSGGLLCASAAVETAASITPKKPEMIRRIKNLPIPPSHRGSAAIAIMAIMPQAWGCGKLCKSALSVAWNGVSGVSWMRVSATSSRLQRLMAIGCVGAVIAIGCGRAAAAPCEFEPQGEARVTEVIDIRSFRLDDGREIR